MNWTCQKCHNFYDVPQYHEHIEEGRIFEGSFECDCIKDGKFKPVRYKLCPDCTKEIEKIICQ